MPTDPSKPPKPVPKTVSGFTILPLILPTSPLLPAQYSSAKHYLYIKPHQPTLRSATDERSLFIANVPIDASESSIRALFQEQLGGSMVERVEFDACVPARKVYKRWKAGTLGGSAGKGKTKGMDAKNRKRKREEEEALVAEGVVEDEDSALPAIWPSSLAKSGSGAVVIFVDKGSARGAWRSVVSAVKEGREVKWRAGGDVVVGVARYISHTHLTYPSPTTLQSSINTYLTSFTHLESLRNKHRSLSRSVPDEEGFVTVTRGGRAGPARIEQAEAKKAELEQRKKKNGVKDDFYRFQNREKRKEVEMGLRRRFEEDRRRVERMREGRRVRPEV